MRREHFTGTLYRSLNPRYAREPLSGAGAKRYGGRFNAIGTQALYLSLNPATALKEANQVGSLQPSVLVAYDADIGPIYDGRGEDLSCPNWRSLMLGGRPVPTHEFARETRKASYVGLLFQSYTKGAGAQDVNIVLWEWSQGLRAIDDQNRLGGL